ncbi:MAG TPA: hypothetical protein PLQ29_05755, partial [Spirochaetales bacterium]|nr:hypothetical protein [Spirochaetales bacterium]
MTDKEKKRFVYIGIAALLALAAIAAIVLALGAGGHSGERERTNMLSLAGEYIDRGDFDRALDILDRLIIKDSSDAEARSLQDLALARKASAKAAAEEAAKAGSGEAGALAQSLGELGKSLERTASTVAQSATRPSQPAAGSSAGSADDSAAAQAAARKAEEDALAKAQSEAEAARRRAAEEELSRKSAELRAKMEAINALVKAGRQSISAGDYAAARSSFDEAVSSLPSGEAKFSAQTYAEIAEGYYDGYRRDPTGAEGLESVKQAQRV